MPKTILIVDDDPDIVEMLHLALSGAGYATRFAASGTEALSKIQRSRPDLVLLDLILPGANGFSVCETLRRDPATATLPIVMMTALPGEFPRMAGMELGADAYLNKPFRVQELVASLDSLLCQPRPAHRNLSLPQQLAA